MSRLIKVACLATLLQFTSSTLAVQVNETELFVPCSTPDIHTSVLNETDSRVFLNINVGEYSVDESGKLTGEKIDYKEGAIKDVNVVVRPSKAILGGKEERRVNFNLFDNSCDAKTDKLYSVAYIPSAVPGDNNTVNLMVGIGGIVTVMPKSPKLSYEIIPTKDKLNIKNTGESVIKGEITKCLGSSKECKATFRVHHTRTFGISKELLGTASKMILTAPSNPEWRVEMSDDEIKKFL